MKRIRVLMVDTLTALRMAPAQLALPGARTHGSNPMSHYYGSLEGSRGKATRCGTKRSGLITHSAAWSGAVRVELGHDGGTGRAWARV